MPDPAHCPPCCGPPVDPRCALCIAPAPDRYFLSASGAVCDNTDCPQQACCECIDENGGFYDLCPFINGSFSFDAGSIIQCPRGHVGPPPKPCFVTAGQFDASIGWLIALGNLGDHQAQWQASLVLTIPGNAFTAVVRWHSPVFPAPMDCSQTVTSWTVDQASLDAYNAKTVNSFGRLVFLYYTNHCDLSNMKLTLHA